MAFNREKKKRKAKAAWLYIRFRFHNRHTEKRQPPVEWKTGTDSAGASQKFFLYSYSRDSILNIVNHGRRVLIARVGLFAECAICFSYFFFLSL